jgi:hypothetical protein
MRSLPQAAPSTRFKRSTRAWLLWLCLALGLVHSMGIWHAYSHSPVEAGDSSIPKQHAAGGAACGLCVGLAGLGTGAPAAQPHLRLQQFEHQPPIFASPVQQQSPQLRPYAIRAPPLVPA